MNRTLLGFVDKHPSRGGLHSSRVAHGHGFLENSKIGWPRAITLSSGGLYYGQESLVENMYIDEKSTWMSMWRKLFRRGVFRRSSLLGNLKRLGQET